MTVDQNSWPASKVVHRDPRKLTPNPRNARKHSAEQIADLARLMREAGVIAPILTDERGVIIYGHARREAAILNIEAGDERFLRYPTNVAKGWTEEQKRAVMLADNAIALRSTWDEDVLRIEIADLKLAGIDLGLTGFDSKALDSLLAAPAEAKDDPVPTVPANPTTRLGDVWIVGGHRVICGDATDPAAVGRLLAGAEPNLMVTDPPYGVNYDPAWRARSGVNLNAKKLGKVQNDDRADWREAWDLFPGGIAYVWHADTHRMAVEASLAASGFTIRATIIWAKDRFALSRGDYHWQHEPCLYGVRKAGRWTGDRSQSTLWNIPSRDDGGHGHGTQKPIECMRRPMVNNSKRGEIVYDPFLGSGTSIIAAESIDRRCFGVELDPGYVDVIVQRWQNLTGKAATLEGDGRQFSVITAERVGGTGARKAPAPSAPSRSRRRPQDETPPVALPDAPEGSPPASPG